MGKGVHGALGGGAKASVTRNTTPEVPRRYKALPAVRAPTPTALAALSPAPAATTTPSRSPSAALHRCAACRWVRCLRQARACAMRPTRRLPQHGRAPGVACTSSHRVPDASDMSLTTSPVSCKRSRSLGSSTVRIWANTSAHACAATAAGAVKPGMARFPVIWRAVGGLREQRAFGAARPSFHRMAGRSTWPLHTQHHRRRACGPTSRCRAPEPRRRAPVRAAGPQRLRLRPASLPGAARSRWGAGGTGHGGVGRGDDGVCFVQQQEL